MAGKCTISIIMCNLFILSNFIHHIKHTLTMYNFIHHTEFTKFIHHTKFNLIMYNFIHHRVCAEQGYVGVGAEVAQGWAHYDEKVDLYSLGGYPLCGGIINLTI
jgi:hypothetical protein